ncbi:MAG: helix-turn-helix domain-containing protein [Ilumatobacteraceae bacterium]
MSTVPATSTMGQRGTYAELGDACATAHAMELIGGRWTYPIVRELMLGPKRFNALMSSVRGITPAVLTARLRELTRTGLVEPVPASAPNPLHAYALTPWAIQLAPILSQLGRWAQSSTTRSDLGGLTPDAVVQAMTTMAADLTPRRSVHIRLHLFDSRTARPADSEYCLRWTSEDFNAERAPCTDARTTVRCDSSVWGRVLFAGLALDESGAIITGAAAPVRVLVRGFQARLRGRSNHMALDATPF